MYETCGRTQNQGERPVSVERHVVAPRTRGAARFISRLQRKSSKKSQCFSFLVQKKHRGPNSSKCCDIVTPDLILVTKISKTM